MMTKIKTNQEINNIRTSGQMLSKVLKLVGESLQAGITTKELANIARAELKSLGGKPAFLGYSGFPDVICISVNEQVVHGIPGQYVVKEGDIVSYDFGVNYNGMITDAARSKIVGSATNSKATKLLNATLQSLDAGIAVLKDGVRVDQISTAIQNVLDKNGLGIVRDLVGHGVGHSLHEDPNIPNFVTKSSGPILRSGMTIAIEPMATLGSHAVYTDIDEWTIVTRDGSLSAHFEDTILITNDGFEILTRE